MNIQPLNIVESTELWNIFLMLRAELKDADIPHRTMIRTRVEETVTHHLKQLQEDMKVSQNLSSSHITIFFLVRCLWDYSPKQWIFDLIQTVPLTWQ